MDARSLMFALVAVIYSMMVQAADITIVDGEPICSSKEVKQEIQFSIIRRNMEIKLNPECWSAWIVVPKYADRIGIIHIGREISCLFPKDAKIEVENTPEGNLFSGMNKFRLRGDGKAVIIVNPSPGVSI